MDCGLRHWILLPSCTAMEQEFTLPIAAAVGGDRKSDRLQRPYRSLLLIIGMLGSLEVKGIDRVQFSLGEIVAGWVLYKVACAVFLEEALREERIAVLIKGMEHFDKGQLVSGDSLVRWQFQITVSFPSKSLFPCYVTQATNVPHIPPRTQVPGKFHGCFLGHSVQEVICLGVKQDGAHRTRSDQKS